MNRLSDLQINCAARRVLVRHWIDLGKISIRTTSAVSHLSGTLAKLPNMTPELTGDKVAEMLDEIRRLPSVRRVTAVFTNWREAGNSWKPILSKGPSLLIPGKELPDTPTILDLTELALEVERQERPV